jgi:phosphoribosylformylglycinamidine cyclo-ligase
MSQSEDSRRATYAEAGVSIDAGNRLVERIKPLVRATMRPEVLSELGGFSGMVAIPAGYREPILVSGTDGVGTKLRLAFETGRHDTIGIDLVAMNVDDIVVVGAEPLYFLDYFACGKLDVGVAERVIGGIAEGCRQAGCALIGGETAEMPGFYPEGEYDLAGFAVGVVEKSRIIDGRRIAVGDRMLGLASSGLHSNGYALARKVAFERLGLALDSKPAALGGPSIADAMLAPTRIYVQALRKLCAAIDVRGMAHVTGGGLVENPPRMLRAPDLAIRIETGAWSVPPLFQLLIEGGQLDAHEARRTFNMGIGMVVCVSAADAPAALTLLREAGEAAWEIGEIVPRTGEPVEFVT